MIHITFQTRTIEAAEKLAEHLMEKHMLMFPTIDRDHEELTWHDGVLSRQTQLLLQGMTKALLYRDLEMVSTELLGSDLVRIYAMPITHMDPYAQKTLLEQVSKI